MKGENTVRSDGGPICSICTRDWDERLGYCEHCESADDDGDADHQPHGWRYTPTGFLEDNFS